MRRYDKTPILGLRFSYGTSYAIPIIRDNINNGNIRYKESILREAERLDIIAGKEYGDATLYWIIAAASSVGFVLQCPAGTKLKIPLLSDVNKYLS